MSDIAVQFLMAKYHLDEDKARSIVAFWKSFNRDQTVSTITPEQLQLLQAPAAQIAAPSSGVQTVQIPQSFQQLAGGRQTGEEEEESWWEAVWPWGHMQVWNFITDPLWLLAMGTGIGGYTGIRGMTAATLGLPLRSALPTLRPAINIGGVPSSQLMAAKQSPEFAQTLGEWYEGGRIGTQPKISPAEVRQARYLQSTVGRNLLNRTTELKLPTNAISILTEAEIMEAEANPVFAARLRQWFNNGMTGTKPTISGNPLSQGMTFTRLSKPISGVTTRYGITQPSEIQVQPSLTTQRGPWPSHPEGFSGYSTTTEPYAAQPTVPASTGSWTLRNLLTRGPGIFTSLVALPGTIATIGNLAEYVHPTQYVGSTPIPEPLESAIWGKCPSGYKFHEGWSNPNYGGSIKAGCYTNSQIRTIERSIKQAEAVVQNNPFGHG